MQLKQLAHQEKQQNKANPLERFFPYELLQI